MLKLNRVAENDLIIAVSGEFSVSKFKELVQRATNLWPDAPPEIKQFADQVTNGDWMTGAALQDYRRQDTSPGKDTEKFVRKAVKCNLCDSDNLVDVHITDIKAEFKCSHCFCSNIVNFK